MKKITFKFIYYAFFISFVLLSSCAKKEKPLKELKYFKSTYKQCRNEFYESIAIAQNKLGRSFQTGSIKLKTTTDKDLTTDWCYIPPKNNTTNLFVITSGTHGIEGYFGSAMQTLFLKEILPNINLSKTGVLLIHAVNPFGFKYYRRVNEANIDLNRNFSITKDIFKTSNRHYSLINKLLNPVGKASSSFIKDRIFFPLSLISCIIKYGRSTPRTAIQIGQYQFKNGIEYGGNTFSQEKRNIDKILFENIPLSHYKKLYLIDIHTGYGIKGKAQIFAPIINNLKNKTAIEYVFKNYEIDWQGDAKGINNKTKGLFEQYIDDKLLSTPAYRHIICIPICLELGTNNNQNLIPGIETLRTMILENQGYHYGYIDKKSKDRVRSQMLNLFYPNNTAWRTSAIKQYKKLLPDTINKFIKYPENI